MKGVTYSFQNFESVKNMSGQSMHLQKVLTSSRLCILVLRVKSVLIDLATIYSLKDFTKLKLFLGRMIVSGNVHISSMSSVGNDLITSNFKVVVIDFVTAFTTLLQPERRVRTSYFSIDISLTGEPPFKVIDLDPDFSSSKRCISP